MPGRSKRGAMFLTSGTGGSLCPMKPGKRSAGQGWKNRKIRRSAWPQRYRGRFLRDGFRCVHGRVAMHGRGGRDSQMFTRFPGRLKSLGLLGIGIAGGIDVYMAVRQSYDIREVIISCRGLATLLGSISPSASAGNGHFAYVALLAPVQFRLCIEILRPVLELGHMKSPTSHRLSVSAASEVSSEFGPIAPVQHHGGGLGGPGIGKTFHHVTGLVRHGSPRR